MTEIIHLIDQTTSGDLLDQLQLLAGENEPIFSIGPAPDYSEFTRPVKEVHAPLGLATPTAHRIEKLISSARLIHAWSPKAAAVAEILAQSPGRRAIYSLSHRPAKKAIGFFRKLVKRGFAFVVPTQTAVNTLAKVGITRQVYLLPPAAELLDGEDRLTRRKRARELLGIQDHQKLLVTPMEMTRGSGHSYASWTHAIIRQMLPDILLAMPVSGPTRKRVHFFARTTGYNDELFEPEKFASHRLTRRDALAAADIALLLSERDCGVSALAAALSAGLPMAISDCPEMAEWATDEKAALCCPPETPRASSAALLKLIEDPALSEKLAQNALQIARQHFSPSEVRQTLEQIYRELSEKRSLD